MKSEEYSVMTDEELAKRISDGLFVDEAKADGIFESDFSAEYLERAVYVCPFCGFSEFESHGNEVFCKTCGKTVIYGKDKRITGKGFDFPFEFFGQWYDYQQDFVNGINVMEHTSSPIFMDDVKIKEVILRKNKIPHREKASLSLYGDRIVADEGKENEWKLPFSELSAVSVLGKNKLNVYYGEKVYQITGSKRFNALKYVNIYYRWKNIKEGNENGKFLGL